MKDFNKLTNEQQVNLISYTSAKGTTIYYDKILAISDGVIRYSEDGQLKVGPTDFEAIQTGKAIYETYKLSLAKSDAELVLTNKLDNIVKTHFNEELTSITQHFEENYTTLRQTLEDKLQDLSIAEEATKELHTRLSAFSTSFAEFEKDLDIQSLKGTVADVLGVFRPASEELTKAVTLLKTLFRN